MFTGLVQAIGSVLDSSPTSAGTRIRIDAAGWDHSPRAGDSIAVSGCCLTLTADPGPGRILVFDIVRETLSRTTLRDLRAGARVNLEHAPTPRTLLGGHIVQGHIDAVGTVSHAHRGAEHRLRISPPDDFLEFVIPKGSVAVDGVSVTIARVEPAQGFFEVALIPTTLEMTTLCDLRGGDRVNLEADILAKTVIHWLRHYGPGRPPPPS
jgi:riboflavin synthase